MINRADIKSAGKLHAASELRLGRITMHFDGIRNPRLEKVAAELYSDHLPYHNFNHVLNTLAAGAVLVERCHDEGLPINVEAVYYAILFHDAGYQVSHVSKGFTSKEEYSAHLAIQCLRGEAVSEDTIKTAAAAILSTRRDANFSSIEEKIVRAADLAGLASDYKTFRISVEKLRQEDEMLTGRKVAWDEWKASVKEMISFYLSQEIRFTQSDACMDNAAIFYAKANQNLSQLLSEN